MKLLKILGMGSELYGFLALVSVIGILWYTFIQPVQQVDFTLPNGAGIVAYGRLWVLWNTEYYHQPLYAYSLLGFQAAAMLPQFLLARLGIINKGVLYLNLLSTMLVRNIYAAQNVTVIMWASYASFNPIFTAILLLQKMPFGYSWGFSDVHWQNWQYQVAHNPFDWSYAIVAFWIVFPVVFWVSNTKYMESFTKRLLYKVKALIPQTKKPEKTYTWQAEVIFGCAVVAMAFMAYFTLVFVMDSVVL